MLKDTIVFRRDHKWGAKWYLHVLNVTIPSQSDATDIFSICVDIAKNVTATKPSQLKKSQVFPEEALNEGCGKIRAISILNKNTHDIAPSPHRRSSTAAATPQHPTPSELLSLFNYEDNPLPFWEFVDCISLIKEIHKTGEIFSISSRNLDSIVDHNKAHATQLAQATTKQISKILLKYDAP